MTVYGVKKRTSPGSRSRTNGTRSAIPCAQLADPNITVTTSEQRGDGVAVQRLDISPPSDGPRRSSSHQRTSSGSGESRTERDFRRRLVHRLDHVDGSDLVFPEYAPAPRSMRTRWRRSTRPGGRLTRGPYNPSITRTPSSRGALLADRAKRPLDAGRRHERTGSCRSARRRPPRGRESDRGDDGMKIGELFWQLTGQAGKRQIRMRCTPGVPAWGDLIASTAPSW